MSSLLEGQAALANVQPLSTTDVFPKRASRGGVVLGLAAKLFGPHLCSLQHWFAHLLCSEMRPMRKGQILSQGDVETVKYLSCGRNIVQQKNKTSQPKAIRDVLRLCHAFLLFLSESEFGRYCDQRVCKCEPVRIRKQGMSQPWPLHFPNCTQRESGKLRRRLSEYNEDDVRYLSVHT